MVVITGIKTAIKIAPIVYKAGKIIYKSVSKTRQFDRYMARHPKILKYGTIGATGGTLIYDLLNIDYDSLIGTTPSRYRKQQTRGNFQSPGARFQQYSKRGIIPRCRPSKQRQQYRSFYR